jgi:GDP-4-dehydro-6-deoxy-D-mannose reductase
MKRVAVFGITGFSGRHFERFVASEGLDSRFEFYGFGRDLPRAEHSGVFSYCEGDACEPIDVGRFLREVRPEYVLNVTGIFKAETFEKFMAVNVGVSQAICEAVRSHVPDTTKIVFVGSAAEYGSIARNPVKEDDDVCPVSIYGLSKLYQTQLSGYFFRNHRLPTVIARTFNILGKGLSPQLSIGSFMSQIEALPDGGIVKVGNLSTRRDFLHISEVVRRYWNLLLKGVPGEIYNVCSGVPKTMHAVLEDLIRESRKTLSTETDPSLFKEHDIDSIYGDSTKYELLIR